MAPRKNYSPDQIQKAVEAVRNGEKISVAAQRFGVPRITLHDKITGKTSINCTMGPKTILTKSEEDILEKWLLTLSEKHIPLTKDSLLDSVQKIIVNQNRPNPFTNNRPSKKWFQSFMKRHPNLSQRVPDNLSRARDNVSENDIRAWFKEIESFLDEHNLKTVLNYPHRLFNTDESAFFLSPKPGRVIVKKGDKHPYNNCGDEKENLTVLITGNAAGELAPPMIVFNYERIPSSIAVSVPDEWAIGKSESGWMCSSTFYEYVTNVFNPWLEENNIEKPILFFFDGHKSHLTLHLSNFCSQNGIEIFALYPNATHILQPMDLSVFRPLKAHWKNAVVQWKMENLGQSLRKENFAPVLKKALANITKDCIKNGFRAGGLFPFGPEYVDMSKIRQLEKTMTKTNPAQAEFIKYLENEIIKVFSVQKLNQFNTLFFENRNQLENNIPNEDMALFLIWAKNKSEVTCHYNSSKTALMSETLDQTRHLSNNITTAQTNVTLIEESLQAIPLGADVTMVTETATNRVQTETSSKDAIFNKFMENVSLTHNLQESNDDAIDVILPVAEEVEVSDQMLSFESLSPIDYDKETRDPLMDQPNINTNIGTSIGEGLPPPQSSSSDLLNLTGSRMSQWPVISTMALQNKTPQKSIESVLGVIVPSPFKRSLFWPENLDNSKKKMKREKIPATVTSKAWKDYHRNKEFKKNKLQQEKEERAKLRIEKKKLKEQLVSVKKNKTKKTKTERRISCDSLESLDSSLENLSLNKLAVLKATKSKKVKKFSIGTFVIIKYEGEYFPGKVENFRQNEFEISTMTLTTGNTFKYPNPPDKMYYDHTEIVEEIKEPICLNKRGFYRIPEMDKYLPHVYDL